MALAAALATSAEDVPHQCAFQAVEAHQHDHAVTEQQLAGSSGDGETVRVREEGEKGSNTVAAKEVGEQSGLRWDGRVGPEV